MSDIVERLRRNRWRDATTGKFTSPPAYDLAGVEAERLDAAAEIEQLRTALADLATENERLLAVREIVKKSTEFVTRLEPENPRFHYCGGECIRPKLVDALEPPTKPYSRDCLAREIPGGSCQSPNCDC